MRVEGALSFNLTDEQRAISAPSTSHAQTPSYARISIPLMRRFLGQQGFRAVDWRA